MIASPKECRTKEQIAKDEILDYKQYCFDGRVVLKRKKFPPFYAEYNSYQVHLKKWERIRNQPEAKLNLIIRYGKIASYLTEKYPECTNQYLPKREKSEEEN